MYFSVTGFPTCIFIVFGLKMRTQMPPYFNILIVFVDDLISLDDPKKLYLHAVKIGEGGAGEVFLATHSKTKEKVAIKKMKLKAQNLKTIINEIGMMKNCKHDNIVQYIDSYLVSDELWVCIPSQKFRNTTRKPSWSIFTNQAAVKSHS